MEIVGQMRFTSEGLCLSNKNRQLGLGPWSKSASKPMQYLEPQ